MRIAILSRKRSLYTTRRLIEECKEMNIDPVVMNPLKCDIIVGKENHYMYYNRKKQKKVDAIIPRFGFSITHYGNSILRRFADMGIPSVANPDAIAIARDKFHSLQVLSQAGIRVPVTIMVRDLNNISKAIDRVGGVPVIIKLIRGTQGVGVSISESKQAAESTVDAFWRLGRHMLIQQYIIEARGTDVRIIVVDGEIVAGYKRVAKYGEFRSNIHKGAIGETIELSEEHKEIAIKSALTLDLGVAGVDILESVQGLMVLEVNSSPGIEGIEKATKINVGRKIVAYANKLAVESGGFDPEMGK